MAIDVNPPPIPKYPKEIANDREARQYFDQINRIILQLRERTGGDEDLIDANEQGLTSNNSRISRNAAKINSLEKITFDIEKITTDFITSRNQIIVCQNTSLITVTLDPDALEEDQVHIKRTDAVVDVAGIIDGKSNRRINIKNFSLYLAFNGLDWSQI